MKFWPLIRSALLRRPVEAALILLAVTVGFALFGFMLALHATVKQVIDVAREDRLYVNQRFDSLYGLPVALEEQIRTIDGVTGVGAYRSVNGRFQNSQYGAGVYTVDDGMRWAMAEYPITSTQWDELTSSGTGTLVTKKAAARLGLHKGDVFHLSSAGVLQQFADIREDGGTSWTFQVLDIVPDVPEWGDSGVIIGNYKYTENARSRESRGYVLGFRVAVRDPQQAASIARLIDRHYANSATATQSAPHRAAAEAMARSEVSTASLTWAVGTAGLFMIVFLTGNSIAQSVRRRIPEFATLKAMGYTDVRVLWLVLAEAAAPCCLGAVLGTGLAAVFAAIPRSYIPRGLLSVPHASVTIATFEWSCASALLIALIGAAPPILRLRRLDVATAIGGRRR